MWYKFASNKNAYSKLYRCTTKTNKISNFSQKEMLASLIGIYTSIYLIKHNSSNMNTKDTISNKDCNACGYFGNLKNKKKQATKYLQKNH